MPAALDGVTVLDLSEWIAGPYASKLFADAGADVIKVERPGGDPSRGVGPFPGGTPHREKSGTFFYFNSGKRSVVLDLKRAEARDAFLRLVDVADIVLESYRPGVLDRLGVGWERIHARKPEIALVSLAPFGQDSPYRDYKLTDLTLFGMCGEMYSMGVAEAEPMKMYGTAALVQCGAAAAAAAMGALTVSETQGLGQHVDLALADLQFTGTDRRQATEIGNQFSGRMTLRPSGGGAFLILSGVYHCADGYVLFVSANQHLDRVRAMLGHPAWLDDPKWDDPALQFDPDVIGEFDAYFMPWCLDRTKREIWALAREHRVLCGPLFTVEELYADEHFRGRGLFTALDHPDVGRVEVPGRAVLMGATPWRISRPAPRLGQHTREVLTAAGLDGGEVEALIATGAAAPSPTNGAAAS
ncbi:MAG: CoA transferase [Chloroflexota bacterium]|nr:CoA transferase [Chloroflexota bacterium]